MRRIKKIRRKQVKSREIQSNRLHILKQYTINNVYVTQTSHQIKFTNLKDGTAWTMTKKNDTASNIGVSGYKIQIGFPKISQIIYPTQSVRLNTGWNVDQLPTETMMHTFPHKALIQNDIVALPQIMDQTTQGGQLVQIVMNNSPYPIRISLSSEPNEQPRVVQLHPQSLIQLQQFNPLGLIGGILGAACHILPFFG